METMGKANYEGSVQDGKTIGLRAYLTLIGLIIAFVMNSEKKNAFGSLHIRQSLGVILTGLVLAVVSGVPVLGWIVYLFRGVFLFILCVIGLIGAINGNEKEVPFLGTYYQKWFKDI